MTPPPYLIVLNGASSSGKTTTANALLSLLPPPVVLTGLDDTLRRVQPFGSPDANPLMRAFRVLRFRLSNGRLRLFEHLHRAVVAHVRAGRSVIVETTLMDAIALRDAARQFAPLNGYFVAMKPPLWVSEQWESERADRPSGQARRHYDLIHAHNTYDLVLDPSQLTPQECAASILHRVNAAPADAFRQLSE